MKEKYNSRAAGTYREKIATAARQALRSHGSQTFLEDDEPPVPVPPENDFFEENSKPMFLEDLSGMTLSDASARKTIDPNGTL